MHKLTRLYFCLEVSQFYFGPQSFIIILKCKIFTSKNVILKNEI